MSTLAFFGIQNIGLPEGLVILALGLLLFGRRLPEVGRSLGKGIVEFKRGLKGVSDEIEEQSNRPSSPSSTNSDSNRPRAELPQGEKPAAWDGPAEQVRVSRSEKVE